LSIKKELSG